MLKYYFVIILSLIGILDAGYLTWEHYSGFIPPCGTGLFSDCGAVLTSPYAVWFGVPLALIGFIFYVIEFVLAFLALRYRWARQLLVITTFGGLIFSAYFVFLMVVIIQSLCLYCFVSALVSTALFVVVQIWFWKDRKTVIGKVFAWTYPTLVKPIFFLMNPEVIHVRMVRLGSFFGKIPLARFKMSYFLKESDPSLVKNLAGITFPNPVGLAAGFDYNADLTQILGSVGFGFQSIGTITNGAYGGNPKPMLGRLPKSRSLMVNKGYKNLGANATIAKLTGKKFPIPVGVSIGVTNSASMNSPEKVIKDIRVCFEKFEQSQVKHSYYELNISCPNLKVGVSLYAPTTLRQLLEMIDHLKLKRPVFIKMPIEKSDEEYKAMLDVIVKHNIVGVIIGNLSKDRKNPAIHPSEINKYAVGNFSGKPTWESSNHLIKLTRQYVKNKLIIVGCGGIFSAKDAQEKLKLGADLVQLITGMIYQGPQLIGQINRGLIEEK